MVTVLWPDVLICLKEELGYTIHDWKALVLGYSIFDIDLSSWKLNLSERTIIIWVRKNTVQAATVHQILETLQDVLRQLDKSRETVLVLWDGDSREIREYIGMPSYKLVIIDTQEQQSIIEAHNSAIFRGLILQQIPISNLAPYETSTPVSGSRFFGRQHEIEKICNNPRTNFAVLGNRKIGKSSLLREVERVLTSKDVYTPYVLYLDCSVLKTANALVYAIVDRLDPRSIERLHLQQINIFFPKFLQRMHQRYKQRIILLLDEIDDLLVSQYGDWELFKMLVAASARGDCQLVLAGFRTTMRELIDNDSPLFKSAVEIRLPEFNRQQAFELIVQPMENLGIQFKRKNEIVSRIYEETSGHPNLIQYYCRILIEQIESRQIREIVPEDLGEIHNNDELIRYTLGLFMANTDNTEKVCVYAIIKEMSDVNENRFTQEDIDNALQKSGVSLLHTEINNSCQNLVYAGIFRRLDRGYYAFTSPVFGKILRKNFNIDYLISRVKREEAWAG